MYSGCINSIKMISVIPVSKIYILLLKLKKCIPM